MKTTLPHSLRAERILERLGEAVIALDAEMRVTFWNAAAESMTGWTAEEALGRPYLELLVHPKGHEAIRDEVLSVLTAWGEWKGELVYLRRDGSDLFVNVSLRRLTDALGGTEGYVGIGVETGRRRSSDAALQRSEEQVRFQSALLDQVSDAVFATDDARRILFWNKGAERTYGWKAEEVLGRSVDEVVPRVDGGAETRSLKLAIVDAVGALSEEIVLRHRDGRALVIEDATSRVRDAKKRPIGYVSVTRDVSERRRVQRALAESEERYRALVDASPVAAFVHAEGIVRFVNAAAIALLGAPGADGLIGREIITLVHPDDRAKVKKRITAIRERGERVPLVRERLVKSDGTLVPVEVVGVPFTFDGRPAVLALAHDLTERQRAEEELSRAHEEYRVLFDSNPNPMWVYDEQTTAILAVNDTAVAQYGWSRQELLRMTLRDVRPPEDLPQLEAALACDEDVLRRPHRFRHLRKDGSVFYVDITSHRIGFGGRRARVALMTDVSERKRLEEQYLHAQKMQAVGRLAGGVAHDFNNLLTVINGFSDLALGGLPPGDPLVETLGEVRKAGERAASLTRQLLAFSRKQVLEPELIDLNAQIAEDERMLRRLIGEDVILVSLFDPRPLPVLVDPAQVEQIVLNLAVNARDAMPEGGTLTLRTRRSERGPASVPAGEVLAPGPFAILEVEDTGCGMSAETLEHLFEPFFTTKGLGKGMGLGLPTVYGIVRQSGGLIEAESELGKGTTFRIWLPLADEHSVVTPLPERRHLHQGERERILLVEDEPSVRGLVREVLLSAGYDVTETAHAEEARTRFAEANGAFALLLTDAVMPGTSGRDLAAELTGLSRGMKVLLMSGYVDSGTLRPDRPGWPFLPKPFTPEHLTRKVRETLRG